MIWPIIVVAVGLVLTLIGMFVTFRTNPPNPEPLDMVKHAKKQMKFLMAFNLGKIKQPFLTKTEWSRAGFSFLKLGTFLQLFGTAWQVVRLAC
jgi:hypothetical protein